MSRGHGVGCQEARTKAVSPLSGLLAMTVLDPRLKAVGWDLSAPSGADSRDRPRTHSLGRSKKSSHFLTKHQQPKKPRNSDKPEPCTTCAPICRWPPHPNPSVGLLVTEEPSPRSGRLKVAHGASRGNSAPPYQGAPAGASENGSSPRCSLRPSLNHGGSGTQRVRRIASPPFRNQRVSRFPPASRHRQENGSNAPTGAGNRWAHVYPQLARWAILSCPCRGVRRSSRITYGFGRTALCYAPARDTVTC